MMYLPKRIEAYLQGMNFSKDEVGKSAADVYLFDQMVLKIQDLDEESKNEYTMLCWLEGKLPVPKVLCYEEEEGKSYILMTKCEGSELSSSYYMERPKEQARLLVHALKMLWSVDISKCPSDTSLSRKLQMVSQNVSLHQVNIENAEPDTFGEKGFASPEALLSWLKSHCPDEELVLSHGDFCLPNILAKDGEITGFIDLGKCGVADKWCDIALASRSIEHNFCGCYGARSYPGYDEMNLYQHLSIEPNREKLRYYILLDELF